MEKKNDIRSLTLDELTSFFQKNDLDHDEITIIRREILNNGKSRAFINDSPVKLETLKNRTFM